MAKRFIDTNIFNDEWFCNLSHEGKLFFIYFITNCDHAGILKLNSKLCEFQLNIKSSSSVVKELGKSLIEVKPHVFFMPKYIKFQYPDFPKSNVNQQQSAKKILESYNIDFTNIEEFIKSSPTVSQELVNSYDNVNDNVIVKNNISTEIKKIVYPFESSEFKIAFELLLSQPKWRKKSLDAIETALKKLSIVSELEAIEAINDAISGNYQGIFPKAKKPIKISNTFSNLLNA